VKRFFGWLNRVMEVPSSTDPDDARRRRLLNIILAGTLVLCVLMLIFTIWLWFTTDRQTWISEDASVFYAALGVLVASVAIFFLNRKVSGWVASGLFVIIFTVIITFVDTPEELVAGRSLFLFTLPIILAGVLMTPGMIFTVMGLVDLLLISLSLQTDSPWIFLPGPVMTFAFISLLIWLASRSLEVALKDLRQVNVNLDKLVQERTKELASALSRERVEAGRSKAILESIADGVVVFDLNGVATIANPSSMRLLDLSITKVVGSTLEQLGETKPLDDQSRNNLVGLFSKPVGQTVGIRIGWGRKTLSVSAAPVTDTQGEHTGNVVVFRDYTHEAEVERMKNSFLAIVSHELRTPLNAILGYAEMLKEAIYGPINEKQLRASDRIMTNSHRLLDIVSDLLDQAQMEAGKLSLHIKPFRPAELIENVHGVMDKIAADKGLKITHELDPGLPSQIEGDMARLQQILVNLLNNAVKFSEKGVILLCLAHEGTDKWSLAVQDPGIGIPEEDLPSIFDAFKQVDSTATRKYGGFGLGLSIVKQLAGLMGGRIDVSSKLGTGSRFTVTLPLVPEERSAQ
jgi:PAS domain S-box-containing protein